MLPKPAVTLVIEGYRVFGEAGCNRYQATFENPERTDPKIGPVLTTRRTCDPLVQVQGDEFLARLLATTSFTFVAGRLGLFYGVDGVVGTLALRNDGPVTASDR